MDVSHLLQRALDSHRQGRLEEAARLYEQILFQEPENAAGLQLLGTLRGQQGRYLEAIRLTETALRSRPDDFGALVNYGSVLMAAGRPLDAIGQFDRALALKPDFFEALYNRAIALAQMKRFDQAVTSYDKALALRPNSFECWYNRGIAQAAKGCPKDALASYDRALALNPRSAPAYDNRGNVLRDLGQPALALESYERALSLAPDDFRALYNRAIILSDLGRIEEAIASYQKSLAIEPKFTDASFNLGLALLEAGRFSGALTQFDNALAARPADPDILMNRAVALRHLKRHDEALVIYGQALASNPNHAAALLNRAFLLQEMGRFDDALTDYEQTIALDPKEARAWNGRGSLLHAMKRNRDAITNFDKAVEINPDFAAALTNRAHLRWSEHGDYAGAISDLRRSVALAPDQPFARGDLHHLKTYGADWSTFDDDANLIDEGVRNGRQVVRPFVYQALSTSPADLQACSRIFAESLPYVPAEPRSFRYSHDKIRIGYVSGEFREQATAYLMAGLYERHDRGKFEILAVDSGGGDGSATRRRLENAFDKVLCIANLTDAEAMDLIQAHEVDVLVNLNGYFGTPRMGVFAGRAAPVQVNYLGFPATLGARYIDYIVADQIVIPEDERRYYDEQVVYLPGCYQVNDDKRPIAKVTPSRSAMGLPEGAFVFCNFNQSYKITPSTFASWMRILKAVDDSVLWLLDSRPPFAENLSRAAQQQHGLAPSRLIFAPPLPPDQHLSRLKLADLFLDSLPYNAHTTASDALWAGLPLLTCRGTTFPGRVAASLLTAAGLEELIAGSLDDYEAMAVRLGQNRAFATALKAKLAANKSSCPLFDTDRFRQNIEAAYTVMMEVHKRGLAPRSFHVEDPWTGDSNGNKT